MNTQPKALRLADALSAYCTPQDVSEQAAAELRRLQAERDELLAALKALLARDERNTCQHESTFRGGGIWEICDGCGRRWADDEGGRPDWVNPPEWDAALAAIAKAKGTR